MGGQVVLGSEDVLMVDSDFADLGLRVVAQDSIARCAFLLPGEAIGWGQTEKNDGHREPKEDPVESFHGLPSGSLLDTA
jgi:hypothetical protein